MAKRIDFQSLAPCGPVPQDVRLAITRLRGAVRAPVSIGGLAAECGVAERTLSEHFRAFVGLSPAAYLRRLRLAAAREALRAGAAGTSVTEVAQRHQFNHLGRFAGQYRERFGETPRQTLRRARAAMRGQERPAAAGDGAGGGGPARPEMASRERPSIAVLPCLAPGRDPDLGAVADAIGEAVAARLCAVRSLRIVAPTRARAATRDPRRLAAELGARYLLAGRLTADGRRLRLVLWLVDTADGGHVWGDTFDGSRDRPVALQDRVATGVLRAVPSRIRGAEIERAARTAPRSLDAHGLAMRALPCLFASRPDGARRALDLLYAAIEMDPDYALPTALAAWGHGQMVVYTADAEPAEEDRRARQLARRAAILDDADPIVLTARAAVEMMAGELDAAEGLVARALACDPACGWAWGRSGWLHAYRGRPQRAIAHFRRALALGPQASRANLRAGIGAAHFDAGRYADAARWMRGALQDQPDTAWVNRSLSVALARCGEPREASRALDRLRRYNPGLTVSRVVAAVPFRPDFLQRLGNGLSDLGLRP